MSAQIASKTFRRSVSSFSKKREVPTPFPTEYHPIRSASKTKIKLPEGVVHNPPSSIPTPYQTPSAFLPPNDPRKSAPWNQVKHNTSTMPALSERPKSYNLTQAEVLEIQRLRQENPEKWTRKELAKKFGCSKFFISIASNTTVERQAEMDRRLEIIKSTWTQHRTDARSDRERRREIWLRDA